MTNRIRALQIYNYELGLRAIEDSLPPSEKSGIPNGALLSAGSEEDLNRTQVRLEQLQDRLAKREAAVSVEANDAKTIYLRIYLALSVMMIAGAVMKAIDKLYSQSH